MTANVNVDRKLESLAVAIRRNIPHEKQLQLSFRPAVTYNKFGNTSFGVFIATGWDSAGPRQGFIPTGRRNKSSFSRALHAVAINMLIGCCQC